MNLEELGRALIQWSRIKNRVHPAMLKTERVFDTSTRKHVLQVYIVFRCDTAVDCEKIENFFRYIYENFEDIKGKSSITSIKALLRI